MSYCGTRNFRVLCFSQLQLKRLSINCSNRCWSLIRRVNEKSSRTWLHTRSYLAWFIGSLITAAVLVAITGMYHATLELTKKKKLRQRLMGQKFIRLSKIESIWLHTCWPSATEELHAWGLVQVICGAESSVDFFWDTCSREKCMIKNYRFKLFSVQISAFLLEV